MTRKEMCELHFGMVEVVVDAMRIREEDRDVLLSIGYEALTKAAREYNPSKKILFRTFASSKIRGDIRDHLKKVRRETKRYADMENCSEKFLHEQLANLQGEPVEEHNWTLVDACAPEDPINRQLYYECLLGDRTIREVSEENGLSRRAGKERLKRLRLKLKEKLNES